MNKKRKLPKYANGGLGDTIGNIGKSALDVPLTTLGLGDIIPDTAYQGAGAQEFGQFSNIAGGIGKAALPFVAQSFGIPAPAVYAAQSLLGSYNPQQSTSANNSKIYPNGGIISNPNAEVEKQENTLNPDGSTTQYNGPSHSEGGIGTQLDPNTLIFSDRLKLGKKTFADLNKVNMTTKEDKVLDNDKSTALAKTTADLMKTVKNRQSLELYNVQEGIKAKKLNDYAKRLGITSNSYSYGGQVPKYPGGGTTGPYQDPSYYNVPYSITGYDPTGTRYGQYKAQAMGLPSPSTNNPQSLNLPPNPAMIGNTTINPAGQLSNGTLAGANNTINTINSAASGQISPNINNNQSWSTLGQIGMQAGLGLAANMGNIYDLQRSNNAQKETYGRVTPNLLNDSQAVSDNNIAFRGAVDSARDASVGNSSTFLNNRRALAAQRMAANSRIRESYANQNTGIQNQASYYNNDIARQETIANMQNEAQARNLKSNALSNIGHNIYSQGANAIQDNGASNRDKQYLQLLSQLYPQAGRLY